MLEMRPDCERCGADLPPSQGGAFICSLETTFCAECADELGETCPDGGPRAEGQSRFDPDPFPRLTSTPPARPSMRASSH